jgi:hypothetical protein
MLKTFLQLFKGKISVDFAEKYLIKFLEFSSTLLLIIFVIHGFFKRVLKIDSLFYLLVSIYILIFLLLIRLVYLLTTKKIICSEKLYKRVMNRFMLHLILNVVLIILLIIYLK